MDVQLCSPRFLLSSLGTRFHQLPVTGHRMVGFDPEQHSCSDALACFWIQIPAGRDSVASPDHHPSPGETGAACRRQHFFAALCFLDFCTKS